jgi:hypothetical protein
MMKTILYILLIPFSSILYGCFTYYPSRENPESLKIENDDYIKVQKFYLYNNDSVDVSDYDVIYYNKYKNSEKVFICTENDTYEKNQIFGNSSKIKKKEKIIPSEQVKSISVEKRKTNVLKTVITIVGITALTATALYILAMGLIASSLNGKSFGG